MLLSHDHHSDNLDDAGRALLPSATHVVTTRSGARRLGIPSAHGLAPDDSVLLEADGREPLRVGATVCRHGPPLSRPIVGDVIGFTVRRQSRARDDLWVTGDTVLTGGVLRKARELTQVQLAETLGIQQATVAKYERQSDLLLSTLTSYVRAMGGSLKLMVEFPGKEPVALEGLGEIDEPRRRRRGQGVPPVAARP